LPARRFTMAGGRLCVSIYFYDFSEVSNKKYFIMNKATGQ
jgi:hypothetical protein